MCVACGDPATPEGGDKADSAATGDTGGVDTQLGDTNGGDGAEDSGAPDTSGADSAPVDSAAPDGDDPDGESDTAGLDCPGGFGCPCVANNDCESSQCIETPEGKICTKTCIEDCPTGYNCVNTGGVDASSICVPALGNLCNPCSSNGECKATGHGDAACVDQGDAGAFCGIGCTNNDQCPSGHACSDVTDVAGNKVSQCVPKTGACSCSPAAIKKELSTTCYNTVGAAKCAGKRTCLADGKAGAPAGGGLTQCIAASPEAEVCDGKDNDCDGDTDETTCNDNEQCTIDECDPKAGCKNTNKPGSCDADSSQCTEGDACKDGKCVAGASKTCDDGNPCTTDTCDADKGCQFVNNNGPCNADDNACTVNDVCSEGKCTKGPAKSCEIDSPCVIGACKIFGADAGTCKYDVTDGFACNDGSLCTSNELCKGESCLGKQVSCDDLQPCTLDTCDPKIGCVHTSASGPCDDGNPCTGADLCQGDACKGTPINVAQACGDANPCTTDSCDPKLGCQNKPDDGIPCDDGNTCTTLDSCVKGTCTGGPNKCQCATDAECAAKDDDDKCNGSLFCDKSGATWECKVAPATIISCPPSSNVCQILACQKATGQCQPQAKPDGTACDADSSVCTKDDACVSGACKAGVLDTCNDGNPCTDDVCDAKTGCKSTANTAPCDADGSACTEGDVCAAGKCGVGKAKSCDDGEQCTDDSCDAASGACANKQASKSCDDGDGCTSGDVCGLTAQGKWTCQSGKAKDCNDNADCTVDSCDAKTGKCVNESAIGKEVACYSGDPKTKGVGACKAGTQTCKQDGTLTDCGGEVTPKQAEVCGNSADDTCDGNTDEGCAPTSVAGKMVSASMSGKAGNLTLRASAGASIAAGSTAVQGGKWSVDAGFAAWLRALLGGK